MSLEQDETHVRQTQRPQEDLNRVGEYGYMCRITQTKVLLNLANCSRMTEAGFTWDKLKSRKKHKGILRLGTLIVQVTSKKITKNLKSNFLLFFYNSYFKLQCDCFLKYLKIQLEHATRKDQQTKNTIEPTVWSSLVAKGKHYTWVETWCLLFKMTKQNSNMNVKIVLNF